MNRFTKKVSLAAVVITLAGVAGASQSHAQGGPVTNSSWFNTYAADAIANAPRPEKTAQQKVVIVHSAPRVRFHGIGKNRLRDVTHHGVKTRRDDGQLDRLGLAK
ncbi:hypothetical protein [Roseobacter sp. OBYS 0001]|uniref:hypothetical protein n=1 Tax=Roseobacter sp. OBYS 0001 TaxID=882651 RepID=UPI001BBE1FF2|nr:hypothetical protein [Roseobacter sp. OBYS 0001]GIT86563.1 hypothetical protein ROBYS_15790 [Roseobacter sp. OBYS 0001]